MELLIRREEEEAFLKLIEQLPAPQRSVLLLHFLEDFIVECNASIFNEGHPIRNNMQRSGCMLLGYSE